MTNLPWGSNPEESLAKVQAAQNVFAQYNLALAASLEILADRLKLEFWCRDGSAAELYPLQIIPDILRPVWIHSGTARLPLADSIHVFAKDNPASAKPRKGSVILAARASVNRELAYFDFANRDKKETVNLPAGPSLLRVHLYKVVTASGYDTLEDIFNSTGEYGETPGWHDDTEVPGLRVWRGDFSLEGFLADPESLVKALEVPMKE
jgi:hypothetical protein